MTWRIGIERKKSAGSDEKETHLYYYSHSPPPLARRWLVHTTATTTTSMLGGPSLGPFATAATATANTVQRPGRRRCRDLVGQRLPVVGLLAAATTTTTLGRVLLLRRRRPTARVVESMDPKRGRPGGRGPATPASTGRRTGRSTDASRLVPGRRSLHVHDLVERGEGAGWHTAMVLPPAGTVGLDGRPGGRLVGFRVGAPPAAKASAKLDGRPTAAGARAAAAAAAAAATTTTTTTATTTATSRGCQLVGGPAEADLDGRDVVGAGADVLTFLLGVLHRQGKGAFGFGPGRRLRGDPARVDAHGFPGVVKAAAEAVEEGPEEAAQVVDQRRRRRRGGARVFFLILGGWRRHALSLEVRHDH